MSDRGLFVVGFLVGALAGAATTLLLTPMSGDEVRGQLKEKGIELKTEAERLATDAKTQAQDFQEKGRIVLSDNVKKAQDAVQVAQEKLAKPAPPPAEIPAA